MTDLLAAAQALRARIDKVAPPVVNGAAKVIDFAAIAAVRVEDAEPSLPATRRRRVDRDAVSGERLMRDVRHAPDVVGSK